MEGYNNNRSNGMAQTSRSPVARPAVSTEPSRKPSARGGRSIKKQLYWLGGIIIAIALIVTAYLFFFNPNKVDSSRYQAVFLNNGQVYFGKLHAYYTDHPYLTDVYYIQSPTSSSDDSKANIPATSTSLIKLGDEVHKPENMMILNKSSILFVENLKSDSQVAKLIENNDSGTTNTVQTQTPASQNTQDTSKTDKK